MQATSAGTTTRTELRASALGFPPILMQAVTHIGPTLGCIFLVQFLATTVGISESFVFVFGFLMMLTVGISLTQLARHLPSAGGYYTYISRTVSPRAGLLTAWMFFLYGPVIPAQAACLIGFILSGVFKAEFGWPVEWWYFVVVLALLVGLLQYLGVKLSGRVMLITGGIELAIMLALALTGLFSPGAGGFSFAPFDPGKAVGLQGLFLGVVFTIGAFGGFESVAPLAEEAENPRRNLPLAMVGSLLVAGLLYILVMWGVLIGWGTDHFQSLTTSSENPVFAFAKHAWQGGWVLVLFAMLNAILAGNMAASNAATRVFYAMGRSGSLPSTLAKVHPTRKTPVNAILFQTALTLAIGLIMGNWLGPADAGYTLSLLFTIGITFVYIAGNIGTFRLYRQEYKSEFNIVLHVVLPAVGTIALLVALYYAVIPFPPFPIGAAPIAAVVWLVIGGIVTWLASRTGREQWLMEAGRVVAEAEPSPAGGNLG